MTTNLILDFDIQTTIESSLSEVERFDKELEKHFKSKFFVQASLTRLLVSFQVNKNRPVYRWYKYKEGFSVQVEHLFNSSKVEIS